MKRENIVRWVLSSCLVIGVIGYQGISIQQLNRTASESTEQIAIASDSKYADGIYTGSGEGYAGTITVQVTVESGSITDIAVLSAEDEDPPYLKDAKQILKKVIASQTTDLDAISGATHSTWGILDAIDDALEGAENE